MMASCRITLRRSRLAICWVLSKSSGCGPHCGYPKTGLGRGASGSLRRVSSRLPPGVLGQVATSETATTIYHVTQLVRLPNNFATSRRRQDKRSMVRSKRGAEWPMAASGNDQPREEYMGFKLQRRGALLLGFGLLTGLAVVSAANAQSAKYQEAPALAEQVKAGKLP